MLEMGQRFDIISSIDREDRAMLRNNPSVRPMPEDGQEHVGRHVLRLPCSSFGSNAINLLSWGEAPIWADLCKYGKPVGHMSLFLGTFLIPPARQVVSDLH